jgi:hypothetical protein
MNHFKLAKYSWHAQSGNLNLIEQIE